MLTNIERQKLINLIGLRAIVAGRRPKKVSQLIEIIEKSPKNDFGRDPQLPEAAFRLANFCRVYPNHPLRAHIEAVIDYVCDVESTFDDKRFLVGKYLSLCAERAETDDWRLPVRAEDKRKALEIYESLKSVDTVDTTVASAANKLLGRVSKNQVKFPDYFIRDLSLVLSVARSAKNSLKAGKESPSGRKAWAALGYLALDEDAIPDNYGFVGLTDDMYVIGSCAREIVPNIQIIDKRIQEIFRRFPFLNRMRIHEAKKFGYVMSDYFALTCLPIFDWISGDAEHLSHISMVERPTEHTVFASLFSAFAIISDQLANADEHKEEAPLTANDFEEGMIVSLDDASKWIFKGKEYSDEFNQTFVVLEELKNPGSIRRLPIEKFQTSMKPDAKGKFRQRKDGSYNLNAAEILFDLRRFDYHEYRSTKRVFLVCNKNRYEEQMKQLFITGVPWKKSIPIATINASLEVESLSGGIETGSHVLYLVPNLRTLLSYYFSDELIDFESLVLVDGSTELVNMESLLELNEIGVPTHVFTGSISRSRFVNNLAQRGFTTFKWSHKLIEHFLPSIGRSIKTIGVESWEVQIKRDLSPPVEAATFDSEAAAKIYESFREIDQYTKEADMEIDRHVEDCFRTIKRLTLSLLNLNLNCESDALAMKENMESVPKLIDQIKNDRSLDQKQQGLLITHLNVVIENIEIALKDKAAAFLSISTGSFYSFYTSSYSNGRYFSFDQISKEGFGGTCLSGIWPGQKSLARLLNRGLDLNIHFILFAHEYAWFQAFLRNYLSTPTSRSVYKPLEIISELMGDFEIRDDDLMDSNNHLSSFRSKIVSRTYEDDHFARATSVIYLDPDAIIFATERSEFSVLIGGESDLKLSLKYGSEIKEGDRLVFLPNSERDAIREIADRLFLGEGVRAKATRWRNELIAYYKSQSLSFEDIRDNLQAEGVKRGVETVRQWIADDSRIVPSKPREVIPALYKAINQPISDQELSEIFEAAEQVLSAHFKASDYLSEKVRSQLERGANSLRDVEDVRIYEVTIIDSCNDEVPYRILSRPQSVEVING